MARVEIEMNWSDGSALIDAIWNNPRRAAAIVLGVIALAVLSAWGELLGDWILTLFESEPTNPLDEPLRPDQPASEVPLN